jgi:glycerol-3-phosphate dehydrogenase
MSTDCDVLVIGAGIQGAGIAQAAAAAGHAVLVVERSGPAAGTSSRSSKLIHGGLRYLEQFQLDLVRESLRERAILMRIAPSLVRLVPFRIPVYAGMRRPAWQIHAGLALYRALAGRGPGTDFARHAQASWGELDGLERAGLECVFAYQDGQTDDAPRGAPAHARRGGADHAGSRRCAGALAGGQRTDAGDRARGHQRHRPLG